MAEFKAKRAKEIIKVPNHDAYIDKFAGDLDHYDAKVNPASSNPALSNTDLQYHFCKMSKLGNDLPVIIPSMIFKKCSKYSCFRGLKLLLRHVAFGRFILIFKEKDFLQCTMRNL